MKKLLLLATLLVTSLTSCGFEPVYAKKEYRISDNGDVDQKLQNVRLMPLKDRAGQSLQNYLIDRMYRSGYPKHPAYTLDIQLKFTERQLGIQKDATATRAELIGKADMLLRRAGSFEELYRTSVRTRVSYNILDAQYGTLVARENAVDRALEQIADEVVNRLSLYFGRDGAEVPDIETEDTDNVIDNAPSTVPDPFGNGGFNIPVSPGVK